MIGSRSSLDSVMEVGTLAASLDERVKRRSSLTGRGACGETFRYVSHDLRRKGCLLR